MTDPTTPRVTITYAQWIAAYPMFGATVNEVQYDTVVYPYAQQLCRNDWASPVTSDAQLTQLLSVLMAHIAQLLFGSTGIPANTGLVGRISSATEGSVNVATEFPMTQAGAWYNQTQWGALYWTMIKPFRLGAYRSKITQQVQPINFPFGYYGYGGGTGGNDG